MTDLNRCDAHWKNLDNNAGGRRSHNLTDALFDALGRKALWDDYGVVDGIMARIFSFTNAAERPTLIMD